MTSYCEVSQPAFENTFAANLTNYLLNSDVQSSPEPTESLNDSSREDGARPIALIVDDVRDVTDMLSVFLYHAGFEVITADSAPAAIAAARQIQCDVIVSDIGMPGMSGYELAEELRRLPEYANVPMIALTGFAMYDDRERSTQSGFNAHLTKPIDPVHLFEVIEQLRG